MCERLKRSFAMVCAPLLLAIGFNATSLGDDPGAAAAPPAKTQADATNDRTIPTEPGAANEGEEEAARTADAKEETPNEEESEADRQMREFRQFREEIESELKRRQEQMAKAETILEEYRQDLKDEHRSLARERVETSDAWMRDPREDEIRSRRQRLIQLHLWELDRIAPAIEAKIVATSDLRERVRERMQQLMRNRRPGNERPQVVTECQALYSRISNLRHQRPRSTRTPHQGFYEVIVPATDDDVDDDSDSTQPGALGNVWQPLRRMLRLSWNEKYLALDRRHWDYLFVGKTMSDISREVRAEFRTRGADLGNTDPTSSSSRSNPDRSAISCLFENLRNKNGTTGRHSVSSGQSTSLRFDSGQLNATIKVDADRFELDLREQGPPYRWFRIVVGGQKELEVTVTGEHMLHLHQRADGTVRVVELFENQMLHAASASFLDLYAEHTDLVEVSVFPFLRDMGFHVPETRFHVSVQQRTLEMIRNRNNDVAAEFASLLSDLDSPSFVVRESASTQLRKGIDDFAVHIQRAFDEATHTLEVRTRLKQALHEYTDQRKRLNDFVTALRLLDDPQYLVDIMDTADLRDQRTLGNQLSRITDEDFGIDAQRWQQWLAAQPTSSRATSDANPNLSDTEPKNLSE